MAVNGFKKKQSKRISTRHRVKVEKKVREHHRKLKKAARKAPTKEKLRRKDPGVPSSLPFKDDILKEAKRLRELKEQEKLESKQRRKEARAKLLDQKRSLASLAHDAQLRSSQFGLMEEFVAAENEKLESGKPIESSLKAYCKEFKKVVEAADVVLEVLDARDPLGSRCPQVEQAVFSSGSSKKLVLVLNKIDLVPKDNVEAWLKYLRNELPTIAFKSSTQTQNNRLSRSNVPVANASQGLIKSASCLGADVLMKLLSNYSRSRDIKTAIRVGVVGFPNTGKSSLINSLKRSKACNVGNTPGVTKTMQEVQLDKHIKLLDCPGIVMATGDSGVGAILRNAVKIEQLDDPVAPVGVILSRCRKDHMMMQYKLPMFTDADNFLSLLARRLGMLRKGGIPDVNKAARIVLQDWNSGRLTYYTQPPESHSLPSHISAEIVSEMGKEFDIDALLQDDVNTLKDLKCNPSNAMVVDSDGFTVGTSTVPADSVDVTICDEDEDCEQEDMDSEREDGSESISSKVVQNEKGSKGSSLADVVVPTPSKRKTRLSVVLAARSPVTPDELQMNKLRKKEFKKMKKQRRRTDKLVSNLSNAFQAGVSTGDADYDIHEFID